MQTNLAAFIKDTPEGREADGILRKCVHCGFCTATCPTYQLLGDELDGPRGRIYLIKQVLEGNEPTRKTQLHLDRCLTCRACETTCPSGVRYGRLAEIGREIVDQQVKRTPLEAAMRRALRFVLPYASRFTPLLKLGQAVRPILPGPIKRKVPPKQPARPWPKARHQRRMLVLDGCVQPAIAPDINAAAAVVLDRIGISLISVPGQTCCGAVSHHLSAHEEGLKFMRRNIDAWWPHVEAGAEAIVITASACTAMIKEYADLLAADPEYAEKAARITSITLDISQVLAAENRSALRSKEKRRIAFHSPCTLQHGQKLPRLVEGILSEAGFDLTPVPDAHLCCGSAGTYSILQHELSTRLLKNKVAGLEGGNPQIVATANIGCLAHLQSGTSLPVVHWIQLLAGRETGAGG
ncbi:MAG: glycolate oxidase subunit GlcF [Gammaproteobacteria bacterium]|nr:glycolate oxidase subunit GlcF [Gammaproteobacteria bacterium]MDH3413100.1 glycolate oxidase subunit GlcF [Gammaproteobacteria bacterium]